MVCFFQGALSNMAAIFGQKKEQIKAGAKIMALKLISFEKNHTFAPA
jgi:hypothetical protein